LHQVRSLIGRVERRPGEELNAGLKPGWVFWSALLVGLAVRVYLVCFTEGTYDVGIWERHARGVCELGLTDYYHANPEMNHPPVMAIFMSWLWRWAQATGVGFGFWLRAPLAFLDVATAFLILQILHDNRRRFLITGCYWLYPLTMIYSSYHGNTDMSLPFFALLSVYLLSKDKILWAGILLGMSLWIKLPFILIIPAMVFSLPGWKRPLKFLLTVVLAGGAAYLIPLLYDPGIIYTNIFAYRGQLIQTTAGTPVWGMRIFLTNITTPVLFYLQHNTTLCIALIVLFSFLRRSQRTFEGRALTVVGIYTILYGFSNYWSFQYFAWSLPFWFFAPLFFSLPAALLAAAYIYGLYWLLCGNPWLWGEWDFIGNPNWPASLIVFRNLAVLFFFFSGGVFLLQGAAAESVRWYRRLCGKPVKQKRKKARKNSH